MAFSNYALEQMGFRRLQQGEVLSASFSCVHAFEIQGVSLSTENIITDSGSIDGVNYRFAIAGTLNLAAKSLVDYDFAEDESAWAAEHKCEPPYLLVYVGPTSTHVMTGDFLKEESSGLRTYDGFIPARRELREMDAKVIPSFMAALSCIFGTLRNPVKFRELDRAVEGRSTDGATVFDFGVSMRADLRVGQAVSATECIDLVARATDLANRMNPKVAQFYHLALKEDDPLKRFLYLFLTIERQTHAAFKSIDHGARLAGLLQTPERVQLSATAFFETQHKRWSTLHERFAWCALTVWTHITDEDVGNFVEVKKVRDQIAHGEIAKPSVGAVALVERVAAKLQLAPHGGDA